MKTLFGVYFTDVLKELCARVGANFEDIDFSKDGWFKEYSWTEDEEKDFVIWFAKFLNHKGARTEITKYPSLLKLRSQREKFARKFVSNFGWKIKE